jgi:CBS domain-containing protein
VEIMAKTVREAMTPSPCTVTRSTPVVEAARRMSSEDVGSLPVVEGDDILVGIVTDRDIALRVVAAGLDPSTMQVGEILSERPTTAFPDEPLSDALEMMAYRQVRRLPVTEDDRLVGMLTQADVAHEVRDKKVGQLVEEISQPAEEEAHPFVTRAM